MPNIANITFKTEIFLERNHSHCHKHPHYLFLPLHAVNADEPPMGVVRKFVHLLDHSDQDFQEELELMRLREEVVTNIRSNQQLENDLNLMDIKIGLLVKNKITLQEVVSHSKKLTKKNKGTLSNMMMMNKQKGGLKALSKEKRIKLEAYQYLFYLLQVSVATAFTPGHRWKTSVSTKPYI